MSAVANNISVCPPINRYTNDVNEPSFCHKLTLKVKLWVGRVGGQDLWPRRTCFRLVPFLLSPFCLGCNNFSLFSWVACLPDVWWSRSAANEVHVNRQTRAERERETSWNPEIHPKSKGEVPCKVQSKIHSWTSALHYRYNLEPDHHELLMNNKQMFWNDSKSDLLVTIRP